MKKEQLAQLELDLDGFSAMLFKQAGHHTGEMTTIEYVLGYIKREYNEAELKETATKAIS